MRINATAGPAPTTRVIVAVGAVIAATGVVMAGTHNGAPGRSADPDCGSFVLSFETIAAGYNVDDCPETPRQVRIENRFEALVPPTDGFVTLESDAPDGAATSFEVRADRHGTVRVHLATNEEPLRAAFATLAQESVTVNGEATISLTTIAPG